jgi:hypothetical protein
VRNVYSWKVWKLFAGKYPDFAKNPRNITLELALDGFNPFGEKSKNFVWPINTMEL